MKHTGSNEHGGDNAWKGMMPSDMVNMIVNMASSSASFHSESHPKLSRARSLLLSSFLSSSLAGDETKQSSKSTFAGRQKRKRHDVEDDNEDASLEEDRLALVLIDSVDVSLDNSFHTWQPSSGVSLEEASSHCYSTLDNLVYNLEQVAVDPSKQWILPSYNRVQHAFRADLLGGNDVTRVISNATNQMKVLTEMISQNPEAGEVVLDVVEKHTAATANPVVSFDNGSTASRKTPMVVNPTDAFQNSMNFWLRMNWCNPFPDDLMNAHLARFLVDNGCVPLTTKDVKALEGLSPVEYDKMMMKLATDKVSNFLVNTRTRKWRPSLFQAFDLRRPAGLLLEDSIRIYEEKELRPLTGWDGDKLFESLKDPKYLMKLKSWTSNSKKKPPKEKKTKTTKGSEKKTKAKGGAAAKQSNNKKGTEAKKPSPAAKEVTTKAKPPSASLETPLDQSPCTAFLNAGGSTMLEENDTDAVVADGSTDTDTDAVMADGSSTGDILIEQI